MPSLATFIAVLLASIAYLSTHSYALPPHFQRCFGSLTNSHFTRAALSKLTPEALSTISNCAINSAFATTAYKHLTDKQKEEEDENAGNQENVNKLVETPPSSPIFKKPRSRLRPLLAPSNWKDINSPLPNVEQILADNSRRATWLIQPDVLPNMELPGGLYPPMNHPQPFTYSDDVPPNRNIIWPQESPSSKSWTGTPSVQNRLRYVYDPDMSSLDGLVGVEHLLEGRTKGLDSVKMKIPTKTMKYLTAIEQMSESMNGDEQKPLPIWLTSDPELKAFIQSYQGIAKGKEEQVAKTMSLLMKTLGIPSYLTSGKEAATVNKPPSTNSEDKINFISHPIRSMLEDEPVFKKGALILWMDLKGESKDSSVSESNTKTFLGGDTFPFVSLFFEFKGLNNKKVELQSDALRTQSLLYAVYNARHNFQTAAQLSRYRPWYTFWVVQKGYDMQLLYARTEDLLTLSVALQLGQEPRSSTYVGVVKINGKEVFSLSDSKDIQEFLQTAMFIDHNCRFFMRVKGDDDQIVN